MKKIIGIIILGLLIATILPVESISVQKIIIKGTPNTQKNLESQLIGIGFIKIDTIKYEIKGFVLFGFIDDKIILTEKIDIKCDGPPVFVTLGLTSFVFLIKYNPLE